MLLKNGILFHFIGVGMQIGFVNFNTEEKKRVAKMMQLLQESQAIEELGIGRVRDYFSNTLFPGTSTLQHHAKYFSILPSLYYHAAFKHDKFHGEAELDRFIKEAEIQITRQLAENEDGTPRSGVTGITGIDTYKAAFSDYRKFVKYDPAYIYGGGLVVFGIVPDTSILRLIFELNQKSHAEKSLKVSSKEDDSTGDADEYSGELQIIKTSGEAYDFMNGKTMSLDLTKTEASFLNDCISQTCQGTMLEYLINCEQTIPNNVSYFDLTTLLKDIAPEIKDVYEKSVLFSKLMHLVDWRFNYAYFKSFGEKTKAETCDDEYEKRRQQYLHDLEKEENYVALFDYIRAKDALLTKFCEACYAAIREGNASEVDNLVTMRERAIKRERSKIGNVAYRNQGRQKPMPNTFRWDNVRTIVNEIGNPK